MMESKYQFLPEELTAKGISLETLGIAEIAWKSQAALSIIEIICNRGYPILGGDVYKYDEHFAESTYDSWYCNDTDCIDFIQESKKRALEYISRYCTLNGENYIYSIIFEKR